jgi:hypothetical protein
MKRLSSAITLSILVLSPAVASAAAQKLLLREVVVSPTQAEYIAIYNPGTTAVDLTNYFIADYETYYKVALAPPPAALSADFLVRFPAGATIAPGRTQYISVAGAECFKSACGVTGTFVGFGVLPTYEITIPADTTKASPIVPDMLSPFTGSVGSTRGLTNGGEPLVLFYWDSAAGSLVTDVDYVYYGVAGTANPAVNKTGVTVNGQTYLNDSADDPTHHAPISTGTVTLNTCRVDFTEGNQITTGGNGVNGRNETSENWAATWTACPLTSLTDVDGDTVADTADNCPFDANTNQLDTDNDGVGNVCDNCPVDGNSDQLDTDADSVGDACDLCPTTPGTPADNGCPAGASSSSGAGGAGSGSSSSTGQGGSTSVGSSSSSSTGQGSSSSASTSSSSTGSSSSSSTGSSSSSASSSSSSSSASSSASSSSASSSASSSSASSSSSSGQGGASVGSGASTGSGTSSAQSSSSGATTTTTTTGGSGGADGSGGGGSGGGEPGGCGCATVGSEQPAELPYAPFVALAGMALSLRRRRARR